MRSRHQHHLALTTLAALLLASFCLPSPPFPADSYLAFAEDAARRYEFDQASLLLSRVLANTPQAPAPVYLRAAQVARRAEMLHDAAEYLDEAARRGANRRALELERTLLQAQQGYAARVRPKLERLAADGNDPELIWEALGRGYLRAYRLQEARECFEVLLRLRPRSVPGWLGRAETRRQEPYLPWGFIPIERAGPYYEQAVALAPWDGQARLRLAESLLVFGEGEKVKRAIRHLHILLGQRPRNAVARLLLAQALLLRARGEEWRLRRDRREEARGLLDGLIAEQPRLVPALLKRARIAAEECFETGADGCEEEIAWYRRVLAVEPNQPEALQKMGYQLAFQLLRDGHEEEAMISLERVNLRASAVSDETHRLNDLKCQMVGRLSVEDPLDPALRYEAGQIAMRLGRLEEALLWWERALIEDPQHRPTHRVLADYYAKAGRPGLARLHRRLASGLNP